VVDDRMSINTPPISVTAAFSDQQFKNVAGSATLTGNFFGGTSNTEGKEVTPTKIWAAMEGVSFPTNNMFTANPMGAAGTGINLAVHYGFVIFTSVEPLFVANRDRGGRYYYSTLTLTFNRAVSNPVLHLEGLGGYTKIDNKQLGYSTELELQNSSGLELSKMSGSEALKVEKNKILNSKGQIDSYSDQAAASGSVRIMGSNITELVFKVYLRGDGKAGAWSSTDFFAGDRWMLGVSMNDANISGVVYNDANGLLGTPANKIDGTPVDGSDLDKEMNGAQTLFVNLVGKNKRIVKTTAVATDGKYVFQDVAAAEYDIVLTQKKDAISSLLPEGWLSIGEALNNPAGLAQIDEMPNGILTNVSVKASQAESQFVSFGVNKTPVVQAVSRLVTKMAIGQTYDFLNVEDFEGLSGTDYEDGVLGDGSQFLVTQMPLGADLFYNGKAVSSNEVIEDFRAAKLAMVYKSEESNRVGFKYSFMDRAGNIGAPVAYELIWTNNAVPVELVAFSAKRVTKTVELDWTVTSDKNEDPFDIEHSLNGNDWSNIGQQLSTAMAQSKQYSFIHEAPVAGVNMYRIKMIGADGSFSYSAVRKVNFESLGETFVYPNPAVDVISVKVDGSDDLSNLRALNIYDVTGKLVMSPSLNTDKVDVNVLMNGFYIVQFLKKNGEMTSSKMSIKR
jgi:hypothetical protein